MRSFKAPRALFPGAHIRLIAPASPISDEDFVQGVARLRTRYRVSWADDLRAELGFLSGDDGRRLRELECAIEQPDVDAILPVRGGYGSMRIAHAIELDWIHSAKKLLIGFSDITALHAIFARAGLRSIHGAMVGGVGRSSEEAFTRWIRLAEGETPPPLRGLRCEVSGEATAPLLGGNLALLASLCGTPMFPDLSGSIVFLEDVHEAPYRVDRMLTQLLAAGAFENVAGFVLGTFSECPPGPANIAVEDVLRERLVPLGLPVVSNVPCGHIEETLELPLGALVRLDAMKGILTFLEGACERVQENR